MTRLLGLLLWSSVALADGIPNAHVVYDVNGARWELWASGTRAHLRGPSDETFYDLEKERRVDLKNGRARDEPLVFGHQVRRDELFPRGVKLKRAGKKKLLGKSCDVVRYDQKLDDATVVTTWCMWNQLPLSMEYQESACKRGGKCTHEKAQWKATSLELGAANESNLARK